MWRWRGLLLVLLLCGGCVASIPADVLRDAQFTVESKWSVYLLDGTGDRATSILPRRQTRDGQGPQAKRYDEYLEPSLSPDRTLVTCIRRTGGNSSLWYSEWAPAESADVLVVRIADRSERVVMSIPVTSRGTAHTLAPVWSPDGKRIFFAVDQRIWSYVVSEERLEPVVDLPTDLRGTFELRRYLRVSRDGAKLFALLDSYRRRTTYEAIVEVDLASRRLTPLWTGTLVHHIDIDRPLTATVDDDIAEALFGSREFPVFAPRVSGDPRVYFFSRHEMGLFGREWVAGYDRVTRKEFEVRTMWRTLFWK
jgi:hypothetical protein